MPIRSEKRQRERDGNRDGTKETLRSGEPYLLDHTKCLEEIRGNRKTKEIYFVCARDTENERNVGRKDLEGLQERVHGERNYSPKVSRFRPR